MSVPILFTLAAGGSTGLAALRALALVGESPWLPAEPPLAAGSTAASHAAAGHAEAPPAEPWGVVGVRATARAVELARRWPQAGFLILVEPASVGLAAALGAAACDDPAVWLDAWRADARALLRLIQSHPQRCCCIAWDEACRDPAGFQALVADRLGPLWSEGLAAIVAAPAPDPLAQALARAACQRDLDLDRLQQELLACCQPLGDPAAASLIGAESPLDAGLAARELRALHVARAELSEVRCLLENERGESRQALELLSRRQTQALEEGQRDQKLLLLQLHQLQEELEATFLARRDCEDRIESLGVEREAAQAQLHEARSAWQALGVEHRDAVRARDECRAALEGAHTESQNLASKARQLQADLAQATQARDEALQALAQLRQAEQVLQRQAQELQALLSGLRSEQNQSERERDAARDEQVRGHRLLEGARQREELLQSHVRQLQEELERHFLQAQELRRQAARLGAGAMLPMSVGQVICSAQRDTPPHRELSFTLRELTVRGQTLAEAVVRLVEHNGHPGLVVFASVEGPQLLERWLPGGEEDGRPYMLLLPADDGCAARFEALSRTDWDIVQALAARLERALQDGGDGADFAWGQLARRLREELAEMPPRWRYDSVVVRPVEGQASKTFQLQFEGVRCGQRRLDRCTLLWRPAGTNAGISLLTDERAGPPLPSWPHGADGSPARELSLPLGAQASAAEQQRHWRRLGRADRETLLALLAAWPAQAEQAAGWPAAGAALLRDARRAAGLEGSSAQRLLGRLRRLAQRVS